MDLQQLRSFVEVATLGSIARAALILHRSPPGVSRHVQLLEQDLGTPLFQRRARGMDLTEAGARLLPEARAIIRRLETLRADLRGQPTDLAGSCAIGTSSTFGAVIFGEIAVELRRRHPRIALRMVEGDTFVLTPMLETDNLDIALMIDPIRRPGLIYRALLSEQVFLIGPPGDAALAGLARCTPGDLAGRPLATFIPEQGRRAVIERAARMAHVEPQVLWEIETMGTVVDLVQHGLCYGLVTAKALEGIAPEAAPAAVPVDGLHFTRWLVMERARAEMPIPRAVAAVMAESVLKLVPRTDSVTHAAGATDPI